MLPDRHALVTAVWVALYTLPLVVVAFVWSLFGALWGGGLLVLYLIGFVPYGFFFSLPMMVKLFRKPASIHRR